MNRGEIEYCKLLKEHNYSVKDVSQNSDYWGKDIDCISINRRTGNVATHEIKWDNRIAETGNLYIETYNPRSRNSQGWFCFCEAEYLAYGDAINKIFYVIDVPALKEYVAKNSAELRTVETWDGSQGLAVPLSRIDNLIVEKIKIGG